MELCRNQKMRVKFVQTVNAGSYFIVAEPVPYPQTPKAEAKNTSVIVA